MKKLLFTTLAVFCLSIVISAQPRPVDKTPPPVSKNAPAAFEARYEGGIFGNSAKESGTLKIDEANERVVFYRKDKTEMFSIPYADLLVIYPDSTVGVSPTGNVVSRLPLPGAGLAGLATKSTKYLKITFDDPDVDVQGTANFRFDDKGLLLTFINTLGPKAKMTQRGDAYYRSKKHPVF
jgi:hypothetical protein